VLGPVANRFGADLYLPTGEASSTMVHNLAKSGLDGRKIIILFTPPRSVAKRFSADTRARAVVRAGVKGLGTVRVAHHFQQPQPVLIGVGVGLAVQLFYRTTAVLSAPVKRASKSGPQP
jgi:hypothetical protein